MNVFLHYITKRSWCVLNLQEVRNGVTTRLIYAITEFMYIYIYINATLNMRKRYFNILSR
jgi:hypothetical protein